MKELAKKLDKFADFSQIELSKWTRQILYEFVLEIIGDVIEYESSQD
jgi:hypothetical protein